MTTYTFDKNLIAPCGINCGVCIAYLREKNPCSGCRLRYGYKPKYCITCGIVNCEYLAETKSKFCFDCKKFPCTRLKKLDYRYRKNYRTSLIENLTQIQSSGIEDFLNTEVLKWTCPSCQKIRSIHRDFCLNCKNKY